MCTVSIVPLPGGFRLMCNRDELRTRPAALAPRQVRVGRGEAIMPIDPQGGGSWIAVTSTGLVVTVLNRSTPNDPQNGVPLRSRGELITTLAECDRIDTVAEAIRRIDASGYGGFRIVAAAGHDLLVATSNGRDVEIVRQVLDRPVVFTSSSLGDAAAERMRIPLFEAMVLHNREPLEAQREFHAHRWPSCDVFSVLMSRDDARTVSRSTIEVRDGVPSFVYEPIERDAPCSQPQPH